MLKIDKVIVYWNHCRSRKMKMIINSDTYSISEGLDSKYLLI